jgi:tRNA threonylcarbamoyladenosine biosynthesis protein TsaB
MPLLLNIDTATAFASVGFSRRGELLGISVNEAQKEHAAFLQPAIRELAKRCGVAMAEIDGIALTIGPGSYTGLRVGLSSAKGLAYALGKPLVPVGTLEVMAHAAEMAWAQSAEESPNGTPALFCPMIDARRNEVFTAIYAPGGLTVMEPRALELNAETFDAYADDNLLIFSGDGHLKWKGTYNRDYARFLMIQHSVADLAVLAERKFAQQGFGSLAYLQPTYLKEFHKNS